MKKYLAPYVMVNKNIELGAPFICAYRPLINGSLIMDSVIYYSPSTNLFSALDAKFGTATAAMNYVDEYLEMDGWIFLSQERVDKVKSLL